MALEAGNVEVPIQWSTFKTIVVNVCGQGARGEKVHDEKKAKLHQYF